MLVVDGVGVGVETGVDGVDVDGVGVGVGVTPEPSAEPLAQCAKAGVTFSSSPVALIVPVSVYSSCIAVISVKTAKVIVVPMFKIAAGLGLYDSLAGRRQLVMLPAAGHNDWLAQTDTRWWQQRIDFLLEAPP